MWKKYTFNSAPQLHISMGLLKILAEKNDTGICFYTDENDDEGFFISENKDAVSEGEKTSVACNLNDGLTIVPAMPDKPLILISLPKCKIMPKSELKLFCFIPISIQMYEGKAEKDKLIFEKQTQELSQAWLGATDAGTLAYSLFDSVDFKTDSSVGKAWKAVCPISFINQSKQAVEPNKLSVDATKLRIFDSEGTLCTNDVKLIYNGADSPIETNYGTAKPSVFPKAEQIAEPRNPEEKNILVIGYNFLKSISQYR